MFHFDSKRFNKFYLVKEKLKYLYISLLQKLLDVRGYEIPSEKTLHNFGTNFLYFICAIFYFIFSGINIYQGFSDITSFSYVVATINVLGMIKQMLANQSKVKSLKGHIGVNKVAFIYNNIITMELISIIFVFISMIYACIFKTNILGIPISSTVSLASFLVVSFTVLEEITNIAINLFDAKPKIYQIYRGGKYK